MAWQLDDLTLSHQLIVGSGYPSYLGVGNDKIRGSSYIEGPVVFGDATTFPDIWATVMVGPNSNEDSPEPFIPGELCMGVNNRLVNSPGVNNPYSFAVQGPSAFMGKIDTALGITVGRHLVAQGEVASRCGKHLLSAKKNFDIPHPTKENWRLRHTCPEGPSNDVYVRGRIKNKSEIILPDYWKKLVDFSSITISLTPIGSHQNVIVKGITDNKVILQSNGGLPIDCYYHIFGERKDGERLIPEYPGESPKDYPGNNDEYSISGYHYDTKE